MALGKNYGRIPLTGIYGSLLFAAIACGSGVSQESFRESEERIAALENRAGEAGVPVSRATPPPDSTALADRLDAIEKRIAGLEAAAGEAESRPTEAPPEAESANLKARLAALEKIFNMGADQPAPEATHEPMEMGESASTPQAVVSKATPTPTLGPTPVREPDPTPRPAKVKPTIQEISIIENYAATRFFPQNIVVLKDVPVKLYLTRLHREHVNRFTIQPFFDSSEVILPGEIGVMEFLPDQTGEFKISNVGHNLAATLVVVETEEEASQYIAGRGKQMYALIHSIDDFKIFPDRLVLQKDIPVTIYNISLIAEHEVSFNPFFAPDDINIRPREVTPIEFTPGQTGEFAIKHELHGFTGQLIVKGE